MSESLKKIDHSALRVNQAFIILLVVLAFILNTFWLAAFVAATMLLGSLLRQPGFGFFYHRLLKPAGLVKPEVLLDNQQPHLFAQAFGGTVLAAAAILGAGSSALGWGLAWMVVALAALNLFGGFCLGCAIYYWLQRLRIPGFTQPPPQGTFPGMRPRIKT